MSQHHGRRQGMAKKGQFKEILEYLMRLLFIFIVCVSVVLLVSLYIAQRMNVQPAAREVLFNRIIYSPDTIWAFTPHLNRPDFGTINLNDFSSARLELAITYSTKEHIAARLIITDKVTAKYLELECAEPTWGRGVFSVSAYWSKTVYLNTQLFGDLCPKAISGLEGKGAAQVKVETLPVLIKNNNKLESGWLLIHIITPNS